MAFIQVVDNQKICGVIRTFKKLSSLCKGSIMTKMFRVCFLTNIPVNSIVVSRTFSDYISLGRYGTIRSIETTKTTICQQNSKIQLYKDWIDSKLEEL